MRKFTLFLMSLFLSVGAMAQIEIGTEYRIKEKSTSKYLTVGGNSANTHGEVHGSNKVGEVGSDQQIFTFSDAGNGQYYVKSNSGEYISYTGTGAGWNVNADPSESNAHALTFEETATVGEFYIKCYNQSKNGNCYFKWEYVGASGNYHPFNDAGVNNAATFIVEKARAQVFTVVYKYQYNGNTVKTVTHEVTEGGTYPSADLGLYAVGYAGAPTGTVTAAGEFTITVTVDEAAYPFEFAATYGEIGNKWYNLIMHSNWNTGGGSDKYRTYLGKANSDGSSLEWGTQRSLTNPSDDYFWAFVGDPINGFSVVNKGAGEGHILSSNGTANPLLKEANEENNTVWSISTRKYDVSREGDYIVEGAWFCLKHANGQYMNANAGNGNVAFWTDNDNGSGILAVKPLEINEAADVATYYSDNYITIPSTLGAEVYYANGINEAGNMGLEQITGEVIPAQTGVVVKYNTESNVVYAPEITSKGTTAAVSGNLLKGTTKRTLINKEANKAYYVLGMTDGVGFYNAVNGNNENEFYNGAFKAYLEIEGASETVAFYGFDWAGTTAIEGVEVENEVKVIYDLTGRKVETISAPGIYIVNGVKRVVR